jgi:hypothetical protein
MAAPPSVPMPQPGAIGRPGRAGTAPPAGEPPQSVPEQIAKMKLQMVVYSEVPTQRLIFIDNQKYVEGSSIDGKVIVESITPEGAVLNYQGKRFPLRQ